MRITRDFFASFFKHFKDEAVLGNFPGMIFMDLQELERASWSCIFEQVVA